MERRKNERGKALIKEGRKKKRMKMRNKEEGKESEHEEKDQGMKK